MCVDKTLYEIGDLIVISSLNKIGIILSLQEGFNSGKTNMTFHRRYDVWAHGPFCNVYVDNRIEKISREDILFLKKAKKGDGKK